MPLFRPSLALLSKPVASATRIACKESLANHQPRRPFPTIPTCPPSSCSCSETPQGLDIDYKTPLNGTAAVPNSHVLVLTGQSDWLSKVEDEQATSEWGKFTADLKKAFGRGGAFHDPYKSVAINTCSFKPGTGGEVPSTTGRYATALFSPRPDWTRESGTLSALAFPTFRYITVKPQGQDHIHELASCIAARLPIDERDDRRSPSLNVDTISTPTILVCTHGGRDNRCGVMGPLLVNEFRHQLRGETRGEPDGTAPEVFDPYAINVGGVSHIGGHKWAGNVLVYLPPGWDNAAGDGKEHSPLEGKGIWYGRVEPKHVEGIIRETIFGGKVIEELFRGGMDSEGNALRI